MDWWVWVIIVVVVIAALMAFFEWRSRNKPLARGLEHGPHGDIMGYNREGVHEPFGKHEDLDRPGG